MIPLAIAKQYLRVDGNAFDSEIQRMIFAAQRHVSNKTNHIFGKKERVYTTHRIYDFPIHDTGLLIAKSNYFYTKSIPITLDVGYETFADIPEDLVECVLMVLKAFYYTSEVEGERAKIPMEAIEIMKSYQRFWL
jgi:hypothetical protein